MFRSRSLRMVIVLGMAFLLGLAAARLGGRGHVVASTSQTSAPAPVAQAPDNNPADLAAPDASTWATCTPNNVAAFSNRIHVRCTNYSNDGLTAYDRLALHLMYPEDVRVAEFTGKTVVKVGEALVLRSTLTQQGATAFALKNFQWKVDGVVKSTGDTLNTTFASAGVHTVQFTYRDFLDRDYSSTFTVRVLTAAAFNEQMAAVAEAQLLMMTSSLPTYVYLPTVVR